ncbi:hypothetical protein [Bacillus sp. UNC41MFS5]|uniref:hypothetical protein n=1 Tax=Bacillus sp. UNC41MFS5 TaxID=1449046 RepID=UPI00047BB772|nr:hypothetical protein [Bacillus sp. UNC41MFS5]
MKLAMTLSGENEMIVPIIEGDIIRLYDVETGERQDFENPATQFQTGKRGAVIRWLNERNINLLCAPPKMLCDLSYEAAQKEEFVYYRVQPGTSFSELKQLIDNHGLEITTELSANEIEPSNVPQG